MLINTEGKITLIDEDGIEFKVALEVGENPTAVFFDEGGKMLCAINAGDLAGLAIELRGASEQEHGV